jgi:hypothetical protein
MVEILVFGFSGVPIVWGITQVIKQVGLNPRYVPLVALGVGVLLVNLANPGLEAVVQGIVLGLSATGLHEIGDRVVGVRGV